MKPRRLRTFDYDPTRITPPAPLPGIAAKVPGQCAECSGPIVRGDRISFRRGRAVHCRCPEES